VGSGGEGGGGGGGGGVGGVEDRGDHALVRRRQRERPYCDRRIYVEARLSREKAVFFIRDDGPGFDPLDMPDPTEPPNLDRPSGRGILLMRTFMDEVAYNETGNQIALTKRRNSTPPASQSNP